MRRLSFLFLCTIIILFASCSESADTRPAEARIKEVLDNYIKAWEAADVEAMSKLWAHDAEMVNFGTDAPERWTGWDALKKQYEIVFESFKNVDIAVDHRTIKISKSGTVAWYTQVTTTNFVAKGQPASVSGLRISGVLEKRNGKWLFVHNHSSLPVEEKVIKF